MDRFISWLRTKQGKALLYALVASSFLLSGCQFMSRVAKIASEELSETTDDKTDNPDLSEENGNEETTIVP